MTVCQHLCIHVLHANWQPKQVNGVQSWDRPDQLELKL